MGYANTVPLSQLTFGSPQEPNFEVNKTTATYAFTYASITLPSWLKKSRIKYAFYDLNVPFVQNTNANSNYTDGSQWFQVQVDGGTWRSMNKIFDQSFWVAPTSSFTGYIQNVGNYDIAPYLATDATLTFRWLTPRAVQDSLWFINCWVTLRVIAE